MRAASILLSILLPACGQTGPSLSGPPAEFDGERAFADLRTLVELGPRRMDTPQSAATRAYIREQLEPLGWEFEEVTFPVTPPEGARRQGPLTGTNLLARWPGTSSAEIWLASHYDTYDRPRFVGANDGGSSTAALIEAGRQLAGDKPRSGVSLVLCWFDGEEPFFDMPWDDKTNSTFGSRYQVEKMKEEQTLKRVKALVLLDLVGDKQLGVSIESMSTGWLRSIMERTASALGHKQLFVDRREIKDDHLPFIRAGVPAINLIDFNFGTGNKYWHTLEDTLDKCSAESLDVIGTVVLSALPAIEKRALAESSPD